MYCRFYGLAAKPFKPTPDPRYLYLSPGHREALASILYNIHGHYGIVALEGEVGTGKTTIMKAALESADNKLIQIVLAGQPELLIKLRRPDLRQFNQRVARILSIDPLNEIQTHRYIQHRMRIAGHRGPLVFDTKALSLIWRYSEGVPRLINKICENALLFNYVSGHKMVPAVVIREVAKKLRLNRSWFSWPIGKSAVLDWLSVR